MPQTLHIQLLGNFSMSYGEKRVVSVNTARLQSLLAYLILHAETPQLRQHVAFLFWPESTDAQARNNLRQALYALRQALPDHNTFLHADTNTLYWRPNAPFRLDVAEFVSALEAASVQQEHGSRRKALEDAIGIYQADLLPSCYDEWILPERDRIRQKYLQALDQLVHLLEDQRDFAAALGYAQCVVRDNPLNEDGYRTLMELQALRGDRAGALSTYHACVSTLQRSLGVEPSSETQEVYERLLHGSAEEPSQLRTAASSERAPSMIGRHREWALLLETWQHARDGKSGLALITGEAGIGKSRLAEELLLWVRQQGATTARTRCYDAEGPLSLAPVTEWLRSDGLRRALTRLQPVWLTEVARILPELSTEYPDLPHHEPISEYGQRQRFFEALAQSVLAAPQPLLLLIDDLQWCDQETLEWLHFLLRFAPTAHLLVVGTVRLEDMSLRHPLRSLLLDLHNRAEVREIELRPLDAAESAKLAGLVANRKLNTSSAMYLYRETEGNPLFIVETMRAGFDTPLEDDETPGSPEVPSSTPPIPPRVQAVIAARLGQLSTPARELAAVAAAIGREFRLDVVTRAGNVDEDSAVHALDELWQRRIVRAQGANTYDFTHDKLREVAYAQISIPQRTLLHRRIAQALESIYVDNLDAVSGQLGSHYERAGLAAQAISYYQRAATASQRLVAYDDASRLLEHCLVLLKQSPRGATRDRNELRILLALAPMYRITRGWTAPELERVVNRALTLCDTVGDKAQRAEALYGFESMLVVQGQLERVQLVNDELHALYESIDGQVPPFADMMLVGARLHLGRVSEANETFAHILTTYDVHQARRVQEAQGWNIAVHVRAWRAHALWLLGYPDQARASALEAVQLAQSFEEPFNQALAATYLSLLWQLSASAEESRARAEEALALTTEYKAPYYRAWAEVMAVIAHIPQHSNEGDIASLQAVIDEFKTTGARIRLPYYLAMLADACGRAELPKQGLLAIGDALAQTRVSNEHWWDAELHRIRAELLFAAGLDRLEVDTALSRAVDIARSQQSRSLELRVLITRCQISDEGQQAEQAHRALHDLYAQFTEGFDTPDLQTAKALLAKRR